MKAYAGYSATMFSHHQLQRTARMLARVVPHLMQKHGAHFVAVRGKSGIALAFAMNAVSSTDIAIVVCRKETDMSHGERIEGPDIWIDRSRYLILDDFVSSGATVAGIANALLEHSAVCVGVIEYDRDREVQSFQGRTKFRYPRLGDFPVFGAKRVEVELQDADEHCA